MTTPETHWSNGTHGERVQHEGPKDSCALPDCPKGPAVTAEGRVRLLLAISGHESLGDEIIYDQRFRSEEWPRSAYALRRQDLEFVLTSLSMAREIRDANADRIDEKAEENSRLIEVLRQVSERITELEETVKIFQRDGQHWFAYGYQKNLAEPDEPQNFVDHCRICNKDKGFPAHFAADSKFLDSREVEKAVLSLLVRMGMGEELAKPVAAEVVDGLKK